MYNKFLVPIAFENEESDQRAVDIARHLGGDSGRLVLLHVIERIPGYAAAFIPKEAAAKGREQATQALEKLAAGDARSEVRVITGHPGRAIVDHAGEQGIDCIVIASHQPGLEDLMIGSTAAWVVRHAGCSVHVIR